MTENNKEMNNGLNDLAYGKENDYEQVREISELIKYDMLRYERKLELQEELL